jgi:hypothetical protein
MFKTIFQSAIKSVRKNNIIIKFLIFAFTAQLRIISVLLLLLLLLLLLFYFQNKYS